MYFAKKYFLAVLLFLCCCSGERGLLYFSALSTGQLVDLKKSSEQMEGFFLTTDLSDFSPTWDKKGFLMYVCIRFLNDKEVNQKLNKAGIPLLVQVSYESTAPVGESVILLSHKTKEVFYYEPTQIFNLQTSPIILDGKEYEILDVHFNSNGRITQIDFKEKNTPLDFLDRSSPFSATGDVEMDNNIDSPVDDDTIDTPPHVVKVKDFAQVRSNDCKKWPILNYKHTAQIPDYLTVSWEKTEMVHKENVNKPAGHNKPRAISSTLPTISRSTGVVKSPTSAVSVSGNTTGGPSSTTSGEDSSGSQVKVPVNYQPPPPIDEEAPYIPIPRVDDKGQPISSDKGEENNETGETGEEEVSGGGGFFGLTDWFGSG